MNNLLDLLGIKTAGVYLLIFLGMIIPSLFVFPAAQKDSLFGIGICLGLVILGNLVAVFPPKEK
jgi:hypothetical protein